MASVKLVYFDVPGRGEIIRLVLAAAVVEFDDVRFQVEDWPKYKPEAPFGQAPFIEYNGKKYGQSVAIANFFARENKAALGDCRVCVCVRERERVSETESTLCFSFDSTDLYGTNNLEAFRIDEVMGLMQDFFNCLVPVYMEEDPPKKEELRLAMVKNDVPRFFGFVVKLLKENGTGYFVGNKLSLADLTVYDMATQLRDVFSYDVAADFPEIKAFVDKVSSNENIKKYIDSRK